MKKEAGLIGRFIQPFLTHQKQLDQKKGKGGENGSPTLIMP
jgi:hypothetical protein